MTDKVDYGELLPYELAARMARRPVGYLPLGTLEWHGEHNALGADYLQALGLFRRAARRFGGVVLPPLWVGPDRVTAQKNGPDLIGMDTAEETTPHRALPGSLYWIPKGLFLTLVEAILAQARRAGFKCIVADGHGPSRWAWAEMVDGWEKQFGLKLVSVQRDFAGRWPAMMDHAARNETSILMAVAPELVDLKRLPVDRKVWPQGVAGEDPRDATAQYGEEVMEAALVMLGEKLEELGV